MPNRGKDTRKGEGYDTWVSDRGRLGEGWLRDLHSWVAAADSVFSGYYEGAAGAKHSDKALWNAVYGEYKRRLDAGHRPGVLENDVRRRMESRRLRTRPRATQGVRADDRPAGAGEVELIHYSSRSIDSLDPDFALTSGIIGEERSTKESPDYVPTGWVYQGHVPGRERQVVSGTRIIGSMEEEPRQEEPMPVQGWSQYDPAKHRTPAGMFRILIREINEIRPEEPEVIFPDPEDLM